MFPGVLACEALNSDHGAKNIYHIYKEGEPSVQTQEDQGSKPSTKVRIAVGIGGVLLLAAIGTFAASKFLQSEEKRAEYVYQDQSGTKVILEGSPCQFGASETARMAGQYSQSVKDVKSLTLYGQGWQKVGCWIKLPTTDEVVVYTNTDKPDTVLELSQFTAQPTNSGNQEPAPKPAEPSLLTRLVTPTFDPEKATAYLLTEVDADTHAQFLYTLSHVMTCQAVYPQIFQKALRQFGDDAMALKAGKSEVGLLKDGQWTNLQSAIPTCHLYQPEKKIIVLMTSKSMLEVPYASFKDKPF